MSAPVVLVPGLIGSFKVPAILAAFGDTPVLAPDLIGYGAGCLGAPEAWSLAQQADHLAAGVRAWMRSQGGGPVHVVGHSVGGAVAMCFAHRHPGLTRSLTSIEGNFTLEDAFWSRRIAAQALAHTEQELAGFRADPGAWLARSGVEATPWTREVAAAWLDNQPAATLRAQARAVVEATGDPAYLAMVASVLDSGVPLHLLAGERSRAGWSVPPWVSGRAASDAVVPGAGHLMMLESPAAFAEAVCAPLRRWAGARA